MEDEELVDVDLNTVDKAGTSLLFDEDIKSKDSPDLITGIPASSIEVLGRQSTSPQLEIAKNLEGESSDGNITVTSDTAIIAPQTREIIANK